MVLHVGDARGEKPPFASGRIAGSYDLLFAYWRVAREKGMEELVEKAMLHDEDYNLLKNIVSKKGRISLWDLLEELTQVFMDRVDERLAVEAASRLGYSVGGKEARSLVARLLAAWLIEAGEYWNMIKIPWS